MAEHGGGESSVSGPFVVTFFPNGGTLAGADTITLEGTDATQFEIDIAARVPTRSGFVFEGWAPHGTIDVVRTQYVAVTSDTTYDAIWEGYSDASFEVTYNAGSGKFPGTGTQSRTEAVLAGERPKLNEIPKRDSHTFIGWKLGNVQVDPLYTRIVRDTEFIAVWDDDADYPDITYTLIYDPNGGWFNSIESHALTVTVTRGVPSAKPETPWRDGYTFNGWSMSAADTSGVISAWPHPTYPEEGETYTYYATWKQEGASTSKTITITFEANGGIFGEIFDYIVQDDNSVIKTITMLSSSTYNLDMTTAPVVSREGYIFKGWEAAGTGIVITDNSVNVTSSTTYVATWRDRNSSPDTPTPSGYSYVVTFDANGGIYTDGSDKHSSNVALNGSVTADEEPTRDAYLFAGWGTSKYATQIVDVSSYKITGDMTFYALWALKEYGLPTNVTIVCNGGAYKEQGGNVTIVATIGTAIRQFYANIKRAGYTLKGFSTSPNSDEVLSASALVSQDMTLYAVWLKDDTVSAQVSVTFNSNGGSFADGTQVTAVSVNSGSTLSSIPSVTRSGYSLLGWSASPTDTTVVSGLSSTTFEADATYYAIWQSNSSNITTNYIVYFIAGDTYGGSKFADGSVTKQVTVSANTKVTVPETPKDTKTTTFNYWSTTKAASWSGTGSPLFDLNTLIKQNTTLYAIYKNQDNSSRFVTVYFDYNGGKLSGQSSVSVDVLIGDKVGKPDNPKRTDYTFKGWYTDTSGKSEDEWDFDDPVTKKMTLYAVWKSKTSSTTTQTTSSSTSNNSSGSGGTNSSTITNPQSTVPLVNTPTTTTPVPITTDANGNVIMSDGTIVPTDSSLTNGANNNNLGGVTVPRTGVEDSQSPWGIVIFLLFCTICIMVIQRRKQKLDA